MRLPLHLIILILSFGQTMFAQNINNESTFKDGIYASYEDFINNDPSYPFESFKIKWEESAFFNKIAIKSCKRYKKGKLKRTDMKTVWGFCLGGVPYIQYSVEVPYLLRFGNQATDLNGKSAFSRIRILGNLCHFNIEDFFPKKSNSIFRSDIFSKEGSGKMIRAQRLLKLDTGKVYEYDEFVFSQLIKDDIALAAQFVNEENRSQKLFLYLQKYNQRNPVASRSIMANNK